MGEIKQEKTRCRYGKQATERSSVPTADGILRAGERKADR